MTFSNTQRQELIAPLNKAHVATRQQAGQTLSYLAAWHVIAEANRIFGFAEWDRETVEMRQLGEPRVTLDKFGKEQMRVGYTARVRITVRAGDTVIVREGCGFGSGIDRDVDQAHESAVKEAESDAMKRALMTFGNAFGLALYDKAQANVVETPPEPVKPPTLSERADRFEDVLRRTKPDDLSKVWAKASGLCAELDATMPERLVELEELYKGLTDLTETPFT
jgi:DNA repair and recombination protein RAD52